MKNMLDHYYTKTFYEDKRDKKYIKVLKVLLISVGIGICSELLAFILMFLYSLINVKNEFINFLLQLIIPFSMISFVIIMYVKKIEGLDIDTLGLGRENRLKKFLKGFLIGILLMGISTAILVISGQATIEWVGFKDLGTVLIVIIGWTIQSSTEELWNRGFLMTRIKNETGSIHLALIFQAAFFSYLHTNNPSVTYIALGQIFIVGILFGVYALYDGSIYGACGIHTAWNWSQGNLFGWKVSGLSPQGGSIFQSISIGEEFLTGGQFGVEGGLIAVIVLVIAIITILLLMRKKYIKTNKYLNI